MCCLQVVRLRGCDSGMFGIEERKLSCGGLVIELVVSELW